MTPAETARVLAKAAAFDQRTIGEADARAWHEILEPIDYTDALAAVTRHYRDETRRVMPADIVRHAKAIRAERRRTEQAAEPLALPSRFEPDVARDVRIEAGLAKCGDVMARLAGRLKPQHKAGDS